MEPRLRPKTLQTKNLRSKTAAARDDRTKRS
jgi:hypothetical protein